MNDMAIKLTQEAVIEISHNDLCALLTDAICPYGAMAHLRVTEITIGTDGFFRSVLSPIPQDGEE
jgi:hypothetical protein